VKKYWIFGLVTVAVLTLDQLTKSLIDSQMRLHESIPIISGLFRLTYIKNPGAAFGLLAESHPYFRAVFFICVSVAAIILIGYYLKREKDSSPLMTLTLSLIMGGALGNLIDRIRFGEVIDFLDFYIGPHHWPAFNVADSAITVGAVLLLYTIISKKTSGKS